MRVPNLHAHPVAVAEDADDQSEDKVSSPQSPVEQAVPVRPEIDLPDDVPPEEAVMANRSGDLDLPDQFPKTQDVYNTYSKLDPDRAGKVLKLSSQANLEPVLVNHNLDQIEKAAKAPGPSFFQQLEDRYPGTTKFLSKPENMAVTHDDLHNLTQHEGLVQEASNALNFLKGIGEGVKTAAIAGLERSSTGLMVHGKPDVALPKDAPMYQSLVSTGAEFVGDAPEMIAGSFLGGIAGATGGGLAGGAIGNLPGTVIGATVGGAAGGAAGGFALPAAIKKAYMDHFEQGDIQNFDQLMGRTYSILKEATKQGLVGVGTAGFGALGKSVGGAVAEKYLTNATLQAAVKTATPLASEVAAMTTLGKGVEGELPTARDFAEGAIFVGGLHGIVHSSVDYLNTRAEGKKVQAAKDFYTAMGDTVEASKLRERLPEAHREYIEQLTKDTPVENVYIPVEAANEYFQSKKLDPEAVTKALGVEDAYNEAQQTGADIKIPLATWVDKVVGTEHYKALENDIKFSPEDLTANELTAHQEETKAIVKKMMDKGSEEKAREPNPRLQELIEKNNNEGLTPQEHDEFARLDQEQNPVDPASQHAADMLEIQNKVSDQLRVAGVDKDQADIYGQFMADRYKARAEARELGESPLDLYKLDIQKGTEKDLPEDDYSQSGFSVAKGTEKDQTEVPLPKDVSTAARSTHGSVDIRASNKDIETRLKKISKLGQYENKHTGDKITFNEGTIEKAVSQGAKKIKRKSDTAFREHLEAAQYVPEMIKNAIYLTKDGDNKERNNQWRYMFSPLEMNGKKYLAKLEIKNDGSKEILHNYAVVPDPSGGAAKPRLDLTSSIPAKSDNLGMSEFLGAVKQARDKYKFFQSDAANSNIRGSIKFKDFGEAVMRLFKNHDQSTFLHEAGHLFLEELVHDATMEGAPEQLKQDLNTVLKWMGLDHVTADQGEHAIRNFVKTEHHEMFARGLEAYAREGRSPSEALRQVFEKFKDWLTSIYKSASELKVELSPEVRAVMDRLVATKEEIAKAAGEAGYNDQETAHLPEEAKSKVRSLQERARQEAEQILFKKQLEEITGKHAEFLTQEHARLTEQAKKDVAEAPIFKAMEDLKQTPGAKKSQAEFAKKFLDGNLKPEAAAKMEELAELYDFNSGKDLAENIIHAEKNDVFNKEVEARVGSQMQQHFMDKEALKEEAMKAIHTEKATELLALEKQMLENLIDKKNTRAEISKRKRFEAAAEAKAAKDQAREILENKPIKDATQFRTYITQERNAAIKVSKAIARGDFEAAAEAKRQQMLNHAIVSEALRNKTEVEKSLNYLSQFQERGRDLKNMPYSFVTQIDQLLSKFGLADKKPLDPAMAEIAEKMQAEGKDNSEISNFTGLKQDANGNWVPETISDMVQRVNDNFFAMMIPDSVINAAEKNYDDLSLKELRDLKSAVKTIAETGRRHDRFLSGYEHVDIKDAAAKIKNSIQTHIGTPYAESLQVGRSNNGPKQKAEMAVRRFNDAFIKTSVNMQTLAKYLDGGRDDGPVHQYILRPLQAAENSKFARWQKMKEDLNGLLTSRFTPKEMSGLKDSSTEIFFPEIGRKLNAEERFAIALNWGNETNRDRVRLGYNLNDEQVGKVLNTLSKADWDFVQKTWDYLDTFRPEVKELEMKINGTEPKWVEASPVQTPHGEYRGGYYPLAYDFERSADAYKNAEQKTELFKQFSAASAQTEQGHLQERVATVKRPVRLSLDVLFNHLENVVHDLEFRPAVIDVARLLRQSDVKSALENSIGVQGYKGISDWLKASASDQGENLTYAEKALQWFRFRTSFVTLALRPLAIVRHLGMNILIGANEIGSRELLGSMKDGLGNWITGNGDLHDFVFEKSDRMKNRMTAKDRDLTDMARKFTNGEKNPIIQHGFFFQHFCDEAVALPLWRAIYDRNVAEHGEEKAISLADEAVTRALGSGTMVDRIGFQRGGELMKLMSMNYSWMSVMFNRAWLNNKMAGLEYNKGNSGKALAIMAKSAVTMFAIPAIYEAFVQEVIHNPQSNNDEERKKRMAMHALDAPFQYVIGLRDIAPLMIHRAMGDKAEQFKLSPVESAVMNLVDPVADGAQLAFTQGKHVDEKYMEEVAHGAAQMTGYPQQLNTWMFNFIDDINHNGQATWKDFLSRKTKK